MSLYNGSRVAYTWSGPWSTPHTMLSVNAVLRGATLGLLLLPVDAQLIDKTLAPNPAGAGIAKSLAQEIGVGRGDVNTPNSSMFIIKRDPFRSIRRGRQIFQRKFTHGQGQGPLTGDGAGNIAADGSIGAGLSDSCSGCHGRP
jgi:hypothetical protein